MTEAPDSLTRHGLRETATLVVILAFVMNLLSRGIGETFAVFLLPIESEMGWSRTTLAGIYAIYMGAHGLAAVVIGWFVDRVGPRVVYTIGLLAYGLAFLLAQFGTEPWHFYLTTGVMAGIAMTAIGMTTATVLITRWYHGPRARQLSPAIGIAYSGMGAGVILWIPITNALIEMLGWRETYRTLGIILCVLAVIVYVLPWSKLQLTPLPMSRFGSVLGGSKDGHLRAALKTKMFWLLFVIMFITAVAMYLVGPQMVAYLVSVGFDSTVASLAFSINGFLTVFGIAGTGWLARYFGMKRVATISYAMSITAVILLACLTVLPVMALLALAILPLGLSQGARGPIVSVQASQAFSGQGLGAIYGAITMGVGLGGMSGAWLSGVFYDVTGGYVLSYSVSVVCALAGVGLFWMMREVPDR
ncbi:MAG: MFS transporter [Arenicellales bacterium]|nr:MFS transporter [Arenicellales bacterium]